MQTPAFPVYVFPSNGIVTFKSYNSILCWHLTRQWSSWFLCLLWICHSSDSLPDITKGCDFLIALVNTVYYVWQIGLFLTFSFKLIRRRTTVEVRDVCMHSHSLLTMPAWVKDLYELNVSKYIDFKMRTFCYFLNYTLCSKQSMCIFNANTIQRVLQEMFHSPTYSWYPKIAFPAGLVVQYFSLSFL